MHLGFRQISSVVQLASAMLMLVCRVFEPRRISKVILIRTENVVLERAFRKVDRLGYHARPVARMLVLRVLRGTAGHQPTYELIMSAVCSNCRLMSLVDRVKS